MSQYFLAILPDKKISEEAEKICDKYCNGLGKHPFPHITVYPPFRPSVSEEELAKLLKHSFSRVEKGGITLNALNFFDKKNKVIYLEPDKKSADFLKKLSDIAEKVLTSNTESVFGEYDSGIFMPHLTIAKRIPAKDFTTVKEKVSDVCINLRFEVNSIYLLKLEKEWRRKKEFKLK